MWFLRTNGVKSIILYLLKEKMASRVVVCSSNDVNCVKSTTYIIQVVGVLDLVVMSKIPCDCHGRGAQGESLWWLCPRSKWM